MPTKSRISGDKKHEFLIKKTNICYSRKKYIKTCNNTDIFSCKRCNETNDHRIKTVFLFDIYHIHFSYGANTDVFATLCLELFFLCILVYTKRNLLCVRILQHLKKDNSLVTNA